MAALVALVLASAATASQGATDDSLPDAAEIVSAYMTMRQWTDRLDLPDLDQREARLPLNNAAGVCVTVRRLGRVVGTSAVLTARHEHDLITRIALGRALSQAMGDPAIAALPEQVRDSVGTGLTLQLEVAGSFTPMLGRTYERLARELDPGLDGIAMRRGDRWAVAFPSQLLAANMADNMTARVRGLATELGMPAVELDALVQQRGVSVYRFRTLQLAQAEPSGLPFETIRNDQLVPDAAVTRRGIVSFADNLARHILNKIFEDDAEAQALGLLGDYHPVADEYRPISGTPLDHALLSFALSRYASSRGVDGELAGIARKQAGRLLDDLAGLADENSGMMASPAIAAAVIYAVDALDDAGGVSTAAAELFDAAVQTVTEPASGDAADAHARAMLAAAAARLLRSEAGSSVQVETVRFMLDAAWDAVPEHQHMALLPWIGWGELDYAATTQQPVQRAGALVRVRELLDASRVTHLDDSFAPDVYGGFAISSSGAPARPTAHVARPAVFLATMLGHRQLTSAEDASPALGRHLQTMRYLMQLAVREQSTWCMRNGERALGGIRASTWNSAQPNAAQAMGLLTAAETLTAMQSD